MHVFLLEPSLFVSFLCVSSTVSISKEGGKEIGELSQTEGYVPVTYDCLMGTKIVESNSSNGHFLSNPQAILRLIRVLNSPTNSTVEVLLTFDNNI